MGRGWRRVPADPGPAHLKAAFAEPEPPRGQLPPGASGVLLPLVAGDEGLCILFTRRTATLAMHPGEVSLPGGRVQPGENPLAAALRETEEEVGIPAARVEVLGHLADFVTHYGKLVCAYVGLVPHDGLPARPASPDEVAELLVVPLQRLLDGRAYEGRALHEAPGDRVVHYWHLPEATIWGITGELLARFLARSTGWAPPKAPRRIAQPAEFRP